MVKLLDHAQQKNIAVEKIVEVRQIRFAFTRRSC